ncbi:catechol O-methyltransferase [Mycobacterium kansasii]|uniref:Catechol O-methyltransferase n=1 Tax=Mycobacterium kansasii TaxID=1768 RepID=A0A1V3WB05_MYCKA|nr:catechol O-methyltransferase [Mycobacterium kansasii]
MLATIDKFAYEKSMLINIGDEKGPILDAAVRRANPALALELGTYCGYGALRIARAAPNARVYSVELAEVNAANARQIWAHAGVADRVTCVVGTIGDGGRTLDKLSNEHGFASGTLDFVFIDHDKKVYLDDLQSILERDWLHPGSIVVADNVLVPGRRSTAPTCGVSKAGCGTPGSTRPTWSTRPWCPTWCWNRSTWVSRRGGALVATPDS